MGKCEELILTREPAGTTIQTHAQHNPSVFTTEFSHHAALPIIFVYLLDDPRQHFKADITGKQENSNTQSSDGYYGMCIICHAILCMLILIYCS